MKKEGDELLACCCLPGKGLLSTLGEMEWGEGREAPWMGRICCCLLVPLGGVAEEEEDGVAGGGGLEKGKRKERKIQKKKRGDRYLWKRVRARVR